MNINISSEHFNNLIKLCKNSRNELSGTMNTKLDNDDVYIVGINLDSKDMVKSAKRTKVEYNVKEYITNTVYDIAFSKNKVYIRFHTHPSFGSAPRPSKADIETLKYTQGLVHRAKPDDLISVVEGIVTDKEVAFYFYDSNKDSVERLPLFIDGVEKIPNSEKSILQVFKESFAEGKSKASK